MKMRSLILTVSIVLVGGIASANSVAVLPAAALNSTNYGLAVTPDGSSTKAYVESDHPNEETSFNVEFYLDPNNVVLADTKLMDIFRAFDTSPVSNHIRVHMQWKATAGNHKVWVWARESTTGNFRFVGKISLLSGVDTKVKIEWTAGAGTGIGRLYKNDGLKGEVTNLDNSGYTVDYVRLGVPSGTVNVCPVGGCSGSFYVDEYVSTR